MECFYPNKDEDNLFTKRDWDKDEPDTWEAQCWLDNKKAERGILYQILQSLKKISICAYEKIQLINRDRFNNKNKARIESIQNKVSGIIKICEKKRTAVINLNTYTEERSYHKLNPYIDYKNGRDDYFNKNNFLHCLKNEFFLQPCMQEKENDNLGFDYYDIYNDIAIMIQTIENKKIDSIDIVLFRKFNEIIKKKDDLSNKDNSDIKKVNYRGYDFKISVRQLECDIEYLIEELLMRIFKNYVLSCKLSGLDNIEKIELIKKYMQEFCLKGDDDQLDIFYNKDLFEMTIHNDSYLEKKIIISHNIFYYALCSLLAELQNLEVFPHFDEGLWITRQFYVRARKEN